MIFRASRKPLQTTSQRSGYPAHPNLDLDFLIGFFLGIRLCVCGLLGN